MDKKKIKAEVTALREMMEPYDLEYLSTTTVNSFCTLDIYKASKTIYTYISTPFEVKTYMLIERAWKDGKKVAVPKIYEKGAMEFCYINSFSEVEHGFRGILEPIDEKVADDVDAVVIVPGFAFDYNLNYIGSSGGFYQRYFDSHTDCRFTKAALAFDFQIYKHLEDVEQHEEGLDIIVTPTMVIQ